MTTAEILQSIHITNRVIGESSAIISVNEAVNANSDDHTVIHHIQNAAMAAEGMMTRQAVDASLEQLTEAYEAFRKPPPPSIETPDGSNPTAYLAGHLEGFARQYRAAVIATVGDVHPERMPKHLRDTLWLAIAAHDAVCQATAAARRNAHSSLLIATGR